MKDFKKLNKLTLFYMLILSLTGCATYMPASLKGTPKSQLAGVYFTSIVSIDGVNVEDYGKDIVYISPGKYRVAYRFKKPIAPIFINYYQLSIGMQVLEDARYEGYLREVSEWSKGPKSGECFLSFKAEREYGNGELREMIRIVEGSTGQKPY